jgi:hypothetical protein
MLARKLPQPTLTAPGDEDRRELTVPRRGCVKQCRIIAARRHFGEKLLLQIWHFLKSAMFWEIAGGQRRGEQLQ